MRMIDADELLRRAREVQRRLCAEGYDEILSMDDLVSLISELTVARLLRKEDFHDQAIPAWKESRKPTRYQGWVVIPYGRIVSDKGEARYWTNPPTEEQREGTPWED